MCEADHGHSHLPICRTDGVRSANFGERLQTLAFDGYRPAIPPTTNDEASEELEFSPTDNVKRPLVLAVQRVF